MRCLRKVIFFTARSKFTFVFGHLSNSRNERRRGPPSKGQPGLKNELFWTPSTRRTEVAAFIGGLFPYIPRAFVFFYPSKQIEFYIKVKALLPLNNCKNIPFINLVNHSRRKKSGTCSNSCGINFRKPLPAFISSAGVTVVNSNRYFYKLARPKRVTIP